MQKYFEINEKGHNIRCKMYYSDLKKAEKAVIFGIGFSGHKDNNAAAVFAEKALSKRKDLMVVVFNWPGHGDDVKKKITLEDCETYLELVLNTVTTEYGISELYGYATSFGGYLFLKYISEHGSPFRKTALRCPAVDMFDVITKNIMQSDDYEKAMKGKEIKVGFERKVNVTGEFLESLKEADLRKKDFMDYADDILIIHGTADEVVPFGDSVTFAEESLLEFIPMEGADHRFHNPQHMSLANKYVMEFFGL